MTSDTSRPPHLVAVYLAAVQFCFALGWVVYVIHLPQLVAQAGMPATWVPWILMADQLVFILTDLAVGLASDRAARIIGRLGLWVLAASGLSALAFLLLPWVAPQGSPLLFGVVTVVWVATSSALRAPPLTLLGRYVARPAQPMMVAVTGFGLGVANAVAPYLALQLKGGDPRLPFLLSALALAAVTAGMVAAERALARHAKAARRLQGGDLPPLPPVPAHPKPLDTMLFVAACIIGSAAFQWHQFVSSAPLWLQHAAAEQLPWLMPVFWVGFNLALLPAGLLARRWGESSAMALGAELAMVGTAGAAFAPGLELLLLAQCLAGAGWAVLLCAAFSGALALGHTGREGLMSGTLSATLALAALARIGLVAAVPPTQPAAVAGWPALAFAVAAVLLVAKAVKR